MSFHDILAARQRLHALGIVPHYDSGGFIQNLFTNPSKTMTVQNGFNASQPGITTTDFAPAMTQGRADYDSGQSTMGQAAGNINNVGQTQLDTVPLIGAQAGAVSDLAGSNGLGGVLAQQQGLAGTLANEAAGRGPNPALEQYKQNVNNAIAQNTGMIASQKGINPALAARMAGENAASMTQGAASNEATLQAQQQLAAQQALGQNLQQQGATVLGQGSLHTTAGNLIGTQVGAEGEAGQSFGAAGSLGNAMAGQGNNLYGTAVSGQGNQNNATNTASLGQQGINAGVASGNQKYTEGTQAGFINAIGGAMGLGGSSGGGGGGGGGSMASLAPLAAGLFANGGEVGDQSQSVLAKILAGTDQSGPFKPVSFGGNSKSGPVQGDTPDDPALGGGAPLANATPYSGDGMGGSYLTSPNTLGMLQPSAPGPAYNGPLAPPAYAKGGTVDAKAVSLAQALMARGGAVPGKANVPGNSLKNDVVPAALSPGEIVLPRSVTEGPNAAEHAKEFVENLRAKAHPTYGHVLRARQELAKAEAKHKAMGGDCAA